MTNRKGKENCFHLYTSPAQSYFQNNISTLDEVNSKIFKILVKSQLFYVFVSESLVPKM